MSAAVALAAAGFSSVQADAIRALMVEMLVDAGNEAAANLIGSRQAMEECVRDMGAKQAEMGVVMATISTEKDLMKNIMEQLNKDAAQTVETMRAQSQGLQQMETRLLTLDIDGKVDQTQDMIKKLNEASAGAFAQLRSSYGGVEQQMEEKFKEADLVVTAINGRLKDIELEWRRGNMSFNVGTGKGGNDGGSGKNYEALVDMKDVKMPHLPDGNPSVQVFRRWWQDLAKYCAKREKDWRGATSLFRVIRGYPNILTAPELPEFQQVCTKWDELVDGYDFQLWDVHIRNKEMYGCVELALDGKCADIVAGVVGSVDGFELLRQLARRFDPISPQAASIYKARIFSLAGKPCESFKKTAERLVDLEKLRLEMVESTGENVEDEIMASVLFPTMDASCQSEIVGMRVKIGLGASAIEIDTGNFKHLAQYIRERLFRERTLVPISASKMDIGAVGNSRDASAQPPSTYDQPSWAGQAYGWDASSA